MEQSSPQGLPDTGQTAATTFSKFRCLPAELRFMIWECAMDEHHQVISGGRARRPKPTALLWTNAESRYLALRRGGHVIVVKKKPPSLSFSYLTAASDTSSFDAIQQSLLSFSYLTAASDTFSFETIQQSRYGEYDFHLYWYEARQCIINNRLDPSFPSENEVHLGTMDPEMAVGLYKNKTYKQFSVRSSLPNSTDRGLHDFRESLGYVAKTCIMKENLYRNLACGSYFWCCALENPCCHSCRCYLFDRMSTILIHPCDPSAPRQDLEQEVVEVDPRGLKAATRGLFGYDNHLIVNLLDAAQIRRAIAILSADEATRAIGLKISILSYQIHTYKCCNGRFTWWEMTVRTAQRMWLHCNYWRLSEDEKAVSSYKPKTWISCPEPCDWDQDDPWVKGILERMPTLLPAVVLVLQA